MLNCTNGLRNSFDENTSVVEGTPLSVILGLDPRTYGKGMVSAHKLAAIQRSAGVYSIECSNPWNA